MKLVFLTVTALLFTVISKLGHPVKPMKVQVGAPLAHARILK